MNGPGVAPKKGMSTLTIVLIIAGVALVLGLGTCIGGAVWFGHQVTGVKDNLADGGLVLVAPPAVVAELAGPKKDYVGSWSTASGKSTLDIKDDGSLKLVQDEKGSKETLSAPIAAFVGNDMEIRVGLVIKLEVTEPPHQANGHWEMTVRGMKLSRN